MFKKTLGTLALTMALSGLASAEEVKIGFLVKQAEEPWFQTEWAFAEKAGKDHGFTVIKIAVRQGLCDLPAGRVPRPGNHGQGQAQ
jgi:L-arabinose transport system substrate-binding protein